jgi:hypothetical protein
VSTVIVAPFVELASRCVRVGLLHEGMLNALTTAVRRQSVLYQRHAIADKVPERGFCLVVELLHRWIRGCVCLTDRESCAMQVETAPSWTDVIAPRDVVDSYHHKLHIWCGPVSC